MDLRAGLELHRNFVARAGQAVSSRDGGENETAFNAQQCSRSLIRSVLLKYVKNRQNDCSSPVDVSGNAFTELRVVPRNYLTSRVGISGRLHLPTSAKISLKARLLHGHAYGLLIAIIQIFCLLHIPWLD
jgi:hypothetical protein